MSRSLSILVSREMRQATIYVLTLAGMPLLIAGFFIVQSHLPLSVLLRRALNLSFAFGALGIMQLIQMTIFKEKAGGGFLFLRMLPVNDSEIISSKLLAILFGVLIICGIPLIATSGAMIYYHVSFPADFWFEAMWVCVSFAALVVGMTACAIQFDSQRAMLVPLLAFGVLFCLGALAWTHFPAFIKWMGRTGIQNWGLVLAVALIWLGWRGTIHLFSRRDFVQLSE